MALDYSIRGDIKVRINAYATYEVGATGIDFIHVFGHILEGRNDDQKAALSKELVRTMVTVFTNVESIACSVEEFALKSYSNRKFL